MNLILVNATDQEYHVKRGEVLAVVDAIQQQPLEMFKPEDKWNDVELEAVSDHPDHTSYQGKVNDTIPLTIQAILRKLKLTRTSIQRPCTTSKF